MTLRLVAPHQRKTSKVDEPTSNTDVRRSQGGTCSRSSREFGCEGLIEALEQSRPKRGRKRTRETIEQQLAAATADAQAASGMKRLEAIQRRNDIHRELASLETMIDITDIESQFIDVAHSYSDRKGIDYATWREFGVTADVLSQAGITR